MGFIWIGTRQGLNRFDGYNFKVYKPDPDIAGSLPHSETTVFCDSKGNLWIGGRQFTRYNRDSDTFTQLFYHDSIPFSFVYSFVEDDNLLWFASATGLYSYDYKTEEITKFMGDAKSLNNVEKQIFNTRAFVIHKDRKNNIWLGSGGLAMINKDRENFKIFTNNIDDNKSLTGNSIRAIYSDSKDNIWIGSGAKGINRFNWSDSTFTHYVIDINRKFSKTLHFIYEDSKGTLWVATRIGLYVYNEQTDSFYLYAQKKHLISSTGHNTINSIFEDKNGGLWLGNRAGGVSYVDLNRKKISHYQTMQNNDNFLNYEVVYSIVKPSPNKLLIGTEQGGVNILNTKTGKYSYLKHDPNNPNSLSNNRVPAIAVDAQKNWWIATYNGLDYYNTITNKFTHYTRKIGDTTTISNNRIEIVLVDSKNNLWIKTGVGVQLLKSGTKNFTTVSNKKLFSLIEKKDGDIIGTDKSVLYKYSTEQGKFIEFKQLSNELEDVRMIHCDAENNLWFGRDRGLTYYNTKLDTTYDYTGKKHGIIPGQILGILQDDNNNLWCSGSSGMCVIYDPLYKKNEFNVRIFTIKEGMQSRLFNHNSCYKDTNGVLYFGGKNGFNAFHSNEIADNKFKPDVVITGLKIFNKNVAINQNFFGTKVLVKSIDETRELTLSYKLNIFAIEFAALHYSSPFNNKYAYMLEGFENEWNYTDAYARTATYSNLSGGDYKFRVKASNGDGIWNEEGTYLKITVLPPWWETAWFRSIIVFLIVAVIIFGIKLREQKVKKEKKKLENIITERTAEINNQKEEVLAQKEEILKKAEKEKVQNWINDGLILLQEYSDKNKDNLQQLTKAVINFFVEYIKVKQCVISIINDKNKEDVHFEVIASYGLNKEKYNNRKIFINEGFSGVCYSDKKTIYITNLPEGYTKIESGFGSTSPKYLLLVPLVLEGVVFGIIEIASYHELSAQYIEFVEKVAANIVSTIFMLKTNTENEKLLTELQEQTQSLTSQEEEMRQNMEEMQATQEDFSNREADLLNEIDILKKLTEH
jgi:ligand-binding sensor domain-containing protein